MLSTLSASPGVNSMPSMSTSAREKEKEKHTRLFWALPKNRVGAEEVRGKYLFPLNSGDGVYVGKSLHGLCNNVELQLTP